MNGEKPLNILADQEYKPDIEIKSGNAGTAPLNGGIPPKAPTPAPQTALQDALANTINTVVPQKKAASMVAPNPLTSSTASINQAGIVNPNPIDPTTGQKIVPGQKAIRTYESDIAEAMSHNKTSVAGIAIAESRKKQKELDKEAEIKKEKEAATSPAPKAPEIHGANIIGPLSSMPRVAQEPSAPSSAISIPMNDEESEPKKSYWKQITLGILSIILIGGGAFGGYYLYKQSALALPAPVAKPVVITSLIPSDKQAILNIDSLNDNQLIAQVVLQLNKNFPASAETSGKIYELILAQKAVSTNTQSIRLPGSAFIEKTKLEMPDILKRSLTDTWMVGAYIDADTGDVPQTIPFLAFTSNFFQNSYAGMLSWESSMPDDLANLLNYKDKARMGENTASTSIASYFGIRGKFIDKEIQNRDVREFVGNQGQTLFLYSFVDKNTLIITTTESALSALIDRIEKQTYVR